MWKLFSVLLSFPWGELPPLPFTTKGICLITESLFLKRYLLLLFIPPPEVTILCHRTIISTATNCDVTIGGRRRVHKEKRKRTFSSSG